MPDDHEAHSHAEQNHAGHAHAGHNQAEHNHAGHAGNSHEHHHAAMPASSATQPAAEPAAHEHASQHDHGSHHEHMIADFRRRLIVSLILSVPVVGLDAMIHSFLGIPHALSFPGRLQIQWILASVIYAYGGWPFLSGLASELRKRQPGMMTLIGVAITVAYGYSTAVVFGLHGEVFLWELATLIDVMLLGHWIEMKSVLGATAALESLARLLPAVAHRRHDGDTEDVAVSELAPGDRVLVKPGEKIPIDGEIKEGRASINESLLTGESRPVEKSPGDSVIGGSINGESAIEIEVRKTGAGTYLAQVIELVRRAQEARSHTQDLANRAALILTIVALSVAAVTLVLWLSSGRQFIFALERAVTVMVISCPHALGLAIPLVIAISTAISARNGLLIRDRTAFERARNITAVLFDKTGTLTQGQFGVTDIIPLSAEADVEVLRLAAALESQSEHPIAQGIVNAARERNLRWPDPSQFRAIPGRGAQASVGGRDVKIVSPSYLSDSGIRVADERVQRAAEQGKTVVHVLVDDRPLGAIALADIIRPESRAALESLRAMGIRIMMITGDARAVADWVAREIGVDEYFAEVTPERKSEKVREVQGRGFVVAMAGDGINDAPALVQADLGIAIGAGTDVAIESADVVLVRSDPRDVAAIIKLARATYRKMVENLVWATGYNVIAIPLAAGVLYSAGIVLSPAAGAALMALSTVIVAINARLLRGSAR